MVKFKLNQLQLVLVFILFAQMGKSFSHARQVKEVTLVVTEKEFAVDRKSNFSLPKEILDSDRNATQVAKIGGRKMKTSYNKTTSEEQQGRNNKKGDKENWKENIMAFSADYRSPKSHPPKNN